MKRTSGYKLNSRESKNHYYDICQKLSKEPKTWLISGVAGFIGSNLLEKLLKLNQNVVGLDNFSTGFNENLISVKSSVKQDQWNNFNMIEGSITDINTCRLACKKVNYVLHQAALGSVPRSLKDPVATNTSNIDGFLNMLVASKEEKVKKMVYAASSSTYGDLASLPKVEDKIGNPLSPYAVTKLVNELYADTFSKNYSYHCVGLRYFNVFGPRQNPSGSYAAVIPKWFLSMIKQDDITINGDGTTSRDFCYIDNVVQANILSATSNLSNHEVFNIAVGDRTSLITLFDLIKSSLKNRQVNYTKNVNFADFRPGDVLHSQADISKAIKLLSYSPTHNIIDGIEETASWYTSLAKE